MLSAIIGHLVGDYLLQNDWMALNKKASSLHCAVHCCICRLVGSAKKPAEPNADGRVELQKGQQ